MIFSILFLFMCICMCLCVGLYTRVQHLFQKMLDYIQLELQGGYEPPSVDARTELWSSGRAATKPSLQPRFFVFTIHKL